MNNYLYKFVFDTNTLEIRSDRQINFEHLANADGYTITIANKGIRLFVNTSKINYVQETIDKPAV